MKNISIQPNGQVLYRSNLGWHTRKDVAIEFGYIPDTKENEHINFSRTTKSLHQDHTPSFKDLLQSL